MGTFPDFFNFPYFLIATISQAGAAAPVMTVGSNNMPFGVGDWSYSGPGSYLYTISDGVFPLNKTFASLCNGIGGGSSPFIRIGRASAVSIALRVFDETETPADGMLDNATLSIVVLK